MNKTLLIHARSGRWLAALAIVILGLGFPNPSPAAESPSVPLAKIIMTNGLVEVSRAGSAVWDPARVNQELYPGDRVRVGEFARATLLLRDDSVVPIKELTTIKLLEKTQRAGLRLLRGVISYFHRGAGGQYDVEGGEVFAVVRGTDFVFEVKPDGAATLTLYDGAVHLSNDFGSLDLRSGEIAQALPGQPPQKTALLTGDKYLPVQWCLYYPAVLDPDDLEPLISDAAFQAEARRLYRRGALVQAAGLFDTNRPPQSPAERVLAAAVWLAAGSVDQAQALLPLADQSPAGRLAQALRQVIASVQRGASASLLIATNTSLLASEWLALAYWHQAAGQLEEARAAARQATAVSPRFGYAWERLAELEFGFGRVAAAEKALAKALELTPDNAQAWALRGFVACAQNRFRAAQEAFETALGLDGALGNAWLGRGLCRIHGGDLEEGRRDLEAAAAREPQRALLRAYLGKAFADEGRRRLARHELDLAQQIDPRDPTAWLYSALLEQRNGNVNRALEDLTVAYALAGNRQLYRSRLLLDQDRAVAAVNLAAVYRDAGMPERGLSEAGRAVALDYANWPAHLFLANNYVTYVQQDLRYETARVSEYLVANLLAPVGAGVLSSSVSQQEYSKLFERNGLGFYSETDYKSHGNFRQSAALYGLVDNTAFSVDGLYLTGRGYATNTDLELSAVTVQFKQQVTPRDTVSLQYFESTSESGDPNKYAHPTNANPSLRLRETVNPVWLAGYHHQWGPGSHTLLQAGRIADQYAYSGNGLGSLAFILDTDLDNRLVSASVVPFSAQQTNQLDLEFYTLEAQQILQTGRNTLVAGARYQTGDFDTRYQVVDEGYFPPEFIPTTATNASATLDHLTLYAYDQFKLFDSLQLEAGLAYDWLRYPSNYQRLPATSGEQGTDGFSPKAGLIWQPLKGSTFRGAYAQSLGGVSIAQSYRLEPTQIAGFNQTYRALMPESVAGLNSAVDYETAQVAWEQKIGERIWVAVQGERLVADVERLRGVYEVYPAETLIGNYREQLDYQERTLRFTFSQLLDSWFSWGVKYQLTDSTYNSHFRDLPAVSTIEGVDALKSSAQSLLQQATFLLRFNHPSGFFAGFDAVWTRQENRNLASENFWTLDAFVGYRLPNRRGELRLGVLNLADQNYTLQTLSPIAWPERERTFALTAKISL